MISNWNWWAPFLTVVAFTAILTYSIQEKVIHWHEKGWVSERKIMWAEIWTVPLCLGVGWYTGYQHAGDPLMAWDGIAASFLGSVASPWLMPYISRGLNSAIPDSWKEPTESSYSSKDKPSS